MSVKLLSKEPTWKERVQMALSPDSNSVIIDPEHPDARVLEIELRTMGCANFRKQHGAVIVAEQNRDYYF